MMARARRLCPVRAYNGRTSDRWTFARGVPRRPRTAGANPLASSEMTHRNILMRRRAHKRVKRFSERAPRECCELRGGACVYSQRVCTRDHRESEKRDESSEREGATNDASLPVCATVQRGRNVPKGSGRRWTAFPGVVVSRTLPLVVVVLTYYYAVVALVSPSPLLCRATHAQTNCSRTLRLRLSVR